MTYERLAAELADRYRLERELGRGGMAVVFLAQDVKHSRQVAVKVLHAEFGGTAFAERFFREIGIAARLAHPNILPLHDSGQAAGRLFYVTPYLEGESLRGWLERERCLPLEVAIGLAGEIADALDYAHRHAVIHRDIKPDNILIADGHAIVADFGIATALAADDARLTSSGLVLGTPRYMSPEQALAGQIDGRSDVYSLACVLYECLVGEPPSAGSTGGFPASLGPKSVARRLQAAQPSAPRHVVEAIQRGLSPDPGDRHPRASDFRRALLADSRARIRNRWWITAGAGTAVLLAAGLMRFRSRASTPAGIFYGVQTLLQLLPPKIFSERRPPARPEDNTLAVPEAGAPIHWEIPCVHIEDRPRFQWRGLMLDVSRHFYSKAEVEKILDEMALHKLNTFHWHLTDDHGWRIEIKKYPKLTEVGAWRTASRIGPPHSDQRNLDAGNAHPDWANVADSKFNPDKRYGGFYTQDDVREIVAYASMRHIVIVPEIEMPGHAVAALAAYPSLNSDTNTYTTDVKAGINSGVFDPSNPETFRFLENVLTEVFQLFPGKYVHVGGDEVNKGVKARTWGQSTNCQALMQREGLKNMDELQSWFTKQIQKFVSAHGKTLIGWTEIAEGGMPADAAIMDWKGGGREAAQEGHDVVMSPTKFCYLDYYQSTNHTTEPHAIGGFLPLEKVYQFDPVPTNLPAQFQSHILGGQCNLWTEYIASLSHVEYMFWPRACALAEATWSSKESRDYDDFTRRLAVDEKRLDEMGVNYRKAAVATP